MIKIFSVLIGLLMFCSIAQAQIQTYTGVGEYFMSDFENMDIAKQRAKLYAQRDAQEQAGVYVESRTEVLNSQVTKDEINTITNGIINVIDTKYETTSQADGTLIRATVKANIGSNQIIDYLNRPADDRSALVAQNQKLQKSIEDQELTIADLKNQLKNLDNSQDKFKLVKAFTVADDDFLANQKINDGNRFYFNNNLDKALEAFNEAIKLNPNNALAYCNRSVIYFDREDYEKALSDANKAVELDPTYALSYYNRGLANQNLQDYEQAVLDYNKAIDLDPNLLAAYNNRGLILYAAQYYAYALNDFNKVIELNPNFAIAYNNRNLIHVALKDFNSALNDVNKAIELKPDYAEAYYNRGNIYYYLHQYQKAIEEYDKAIELNPNFSQAKHNREVVAQQLKQEQQMWG